MASISCLFQILTKDFFHNELGVKYKGKEHRQRKQKQNNKRHLNNSANRHAGETERRQNSI